MKKAPLRKMRAPVVTQYHFTEMKNLEAIKRDGLWANEQGAEDGRHSLVGTSPSVVYLTAMPTLEATDAEMEVIQQDLAKDEPTLVSKRWLRVHDDVPMARFTVQLSSHDRKLKQYGKWPRANYHRRDDLPQRGHGASTYPTLRSRKTSAVQTASPGIVHLTRRHIPLIHILPW